MGGGLAFLLLPSSQIQKWLSKWLRLCDCLAVSCRVFKHLLSNGGYCRSPQYLPQQQTVKHICFLKMYNSELKFHFFGNKAFSRHVYCLVFQYNITIRQLFCRISDCWTLACFSSWFTASGHFPLACDVIGRLLSDVAWALSWLFSAKV